MTMNAVQNVSADFITATENGYLFRTTILTSDGMSVAMFGEGKSVDEAQDKALKKALDTARNASHLLEGTGTEKGQLENELQIARETLAEASYGSRHDNQGHQSIQAGRHQALKDKASLNGGGAKDATPKQKDFIRDLARKRGRNVEEVCRMVCNCPFEDLQGQDADKVIKAITGK